MNAAMDCASGISVERRRRIDQNSEERNAALLVGGYDWTECSGWDIPDLGAGFRSDLKSTTPVWFFEGTWDASTPPPNAEEVARYFTLGAVIKVVRGTHATIDDLFAESSEFRPLVTSFLSGKPTRPPSTIELPTIPSQVGAY